MSQWVGREKWKERYCEEVEGEGRAEGERQGVSEEGGG